MPARVSVSSYGFLAATVVWTLGWIGAASLAVDRVRRSADLPSFVAMAVAVIFGSFGLWMTVRVAASNKATEPEAPAPKEPWFRRITGWFAAIVWSGVAVAWNLGVIGWLIRLAREGRGWSMLILVPWSLIGWFLMVVLFVGLGVLIDSVLDAIRP